MTADVDEGDDGSEVTAVFDEPASWRAEAIEELRLRGSERCAAACPAPGYPQLLDTMIDGLARTPAGPWVDVGAGLGGVADWLTRRTGRQVVALEPNPGSASGAMRLFPLLTVVRSDAEHLPLADASVSGVVISGVISLVDSVDDVIAEAARVLRPRGGLAIADIWSATDVTVSAPPDTLWAVEDVVAIAARHGFDSTGFAICDFSKGWWSSAARQVDEVIEQRHRHKAGFTAWKEDRAHLDQVVRDGLVIAGACVFTLD